MLARVRLTNDIDVLRYAGQYLESLPNRTKNEVYLRALLFALEHNEHAADGARAVLNANCTALLNASNACDFRRLSFRGRDLTGAYLRSADLRGADFRGAVLAHADLSASRLDGADFRDVRGRDSLALGLNLELETKNGRLNCLACNEAKRAVLTANSLGEFYLFVPGRRTVRE